MSSGSAKFLQIVLGQDGAKALAKATEKAPILSSVLVPRTIVSWLETAIRLQYEGEIPGLDNSYISLHKTEEQTFSGALTVADSVHSFDGADLVHVAAAIGVALGISDHTVDPQLKGQDLSKLGKSIDLLVKARVVAEALRDQELEKSSKLDEVKRGLVDLHMDHLPDHLRSAIQRIKDPVLISNFISDKEKEISNHIYGPNEDYLVCDQAASLLRSALRHHNIPHDGYVGTTSDPKQSHAWTQVGDTVLDPTRQGTGNGKILESWPPKEMEKVELPGKHAAPREPLAPTGPEGQKKQPANIAKPTFGKKEIKISKSEAERKCFECGGHQFRDEKLVGCLCFRGLLKSSKIQTTVAADGFTLKFVGYDWDEESMQALISVFKG